MNYEVQHNPKQQRFEVQLGGQSAYLTYTFGDNSVSFDHTFVPVDFRGKGAAAALARAAFEEARSRHWKIVPKCSYVAAYLQRHREFADLLL